MNRLRRFILLHVVIWRFGGEPERILLILMCATAYLFFPGVAIWVFIGAWTLSLPLEFAVTVGLSATNFFFLFPILGLALYTKVSFAELLRLGVFPTPTQEVAAREWLEYLQNHGTHGRLPGATHLAFEFWVVLYGLVLLSVAFGLWVLPVLGHITPLVFLAIDAPIVLWCRRLSVKRVPIIYGRPDAEGFRLSEAKFARRP